MTDQVRPVPEFDAVGLGKELLRACRSGALATLDAETGTPFASLVTVATDHDGSPLLLLSRLAAHTQHLEREARASLLLSQTGKGDPLAHPRLTVIGRAARTAEPRVAARFLARHPKAQLYAGFADFSFWRLEVERAHLNGGFARAAALRGDELVTDLTGAQDLLDGEDEALRRLKTEHPDWTALLATGLAGAPPGPWTATGVDPEGLDLAAGERTVRVPFPVRVLTPASLRQVLHEMTGRVRAGAQKAPDATGT